MKMKNIFYLSILVLLFGTKSIAQDEEDDGPENRRRRFEYEQSLILAPNMPFPYVESFQSHQAVDKRYSDKKNAKIQAGIPNLNWSERGPNNIGGRTRAVMYDPNITNKVWAGGASGGLWYNNDITNANESWQRVDDFWANLDVTTIACNTNQPQIYYAGTGEIAPGGGASVPGGGIWKSTNAGATWEVIPFTILNNVSNNYDFVQIQKIAVSGTGRVYAATNDGLHYSDNGGTSWTKLLDNFIDAQNDGYGDFCDDIEIAAFNVVIVGHRNGNTGSSKIYKITPSDVVTDITPAFSPAEGYRVELAIAPSTVGNLLTIYAVCTDGNVPTGVTSDILWFKKSTNAGTSWTDVTVPKYGTKSFTYGSGAQGGYDLTMAVHPTNPNLVIVGGVTNGRTIDGGITWNVSNYGADLHPDLHNIIFDPNNYNQVLIGSDGGLALSTTYGDAATPSVSPNNFSPRIKGYRVTEFYKMAIKNVANSNYTLAGAQDNGTIKLTQLGLGDGTDITGSDGMNCFIDSDQPNIQIVSTQNINHYLYNETTGANTPLVVKTEKGGFLNPCDYHSGDNVFYAYSGIDSTTVTTKFYAVTSVGSTNTSYAFTVPAIIPVSYIKIGTTSNVLFIGSRFGKIYKIDITNLSTPLTDITPPATMNNFRNVSCIDIGASNNELIVTQSPFNTRSVFYTNDGGTNWILKDENNHGLINIPVYAAIFNPVNRNQVLLGTELGVWSTTNITGANPQWEPTSAYLAHVRVTSFAYRSADNTLAISTMGRGVYTTKLNQPCPTNLILSFLPQGSTRYEAGSSLFVNVAVPSGEYSFDSGNSVIFASGFKVNAGTHLKAYIDGCGGVR